MYNHSGKRSHSPDDILAGLYLLSESDIFSSKKEVFYASLNDIVDRFSPVFEGLSEDFVFDEKGSYPFSESAESALMRLQVAGVITPNFHSRTYEINNVIRSSVIETIKKHIPDEEIVMLEEMSKEFAQDCGAVSYPV